MAQRTPLTTRVPMRVTNPLRLSERREESTNVEGPLSGESRAAQSSSPDLREAKVSWSEESSHSSSLA